MIKYKSLPIEDQLSEAETNEDRQKIVARYWASLRNCEGIDLLKAILRSTELNALNNLYNANSYKSGQYYLAQVQTVQAIRSQLHEAAGTDDDFWEMEASEEF